MKKSFKKFRWFFGQKWWLQKFLLKLTDLYTHTQWSALCVLKWHKSFRTYDYSWGPTLCVTLSNIAAHISILTYFRHLSARSIEKAVVTFSMNRAFSAIVQKPLLSWLFWTVMHQNFSLKYDGAFIHGRGGFFERSYISFLVTWYQLIQKGRSAWKKMA